MKIKQLITFCILLIIVETLMYFTRLELDKARISECKTIANEVISHMNSIKNEYGDYLVTEKSPLPVFESEFCKIVNNSEFPELKPMYDKDRYHFYVLVKSEEEGLWKIDTGKIIQFK